MNTSLKDNFLNIYIFLLILRMVEFNLWQFIAVFAFQLVLSFTTRFAEYALAKRQEKASNE